MKSLRILVALLAGAVIAACIASAVLSHAGVLTVAQPTVTLTVHDASGRVFHVIAHRIQPGFSWDNTSGDITLEMQSDELLCSGFGVKQ
jgi:hypothetical protein